MKKFVSVLMALVMVFLFAMSNLPVSYASELSTIYVTMDASTATPGYQCDGVKDQEEINKAINYVLANNTHDTIHLGPGTYDITDTIYMGGVGNRKIYLEGEGESTVLLLNEDVAWPYNKGMIMQRSESLFKNNFSISNFKMDGNALDANNNQILMYARETEDEESDIFTINYYEINGNRSEAGRYWYDLMFFTGCNDFEVYNMYLINNYNDGLKLKTCNNVKYFGNTIYKLGHDGLYASYSENIEAYDNTITCNINSGLRIYNSRICKFHDNTIWAETSGGSGIEIQQYGSHTVNGVEVYNNTIHDTMLSGIWIFGTNGFTAAQTGNVNVHNNVIYNTGRKSLPPQGGPGGILVCGFNATIENNTIDDCFGWGIGTKDVYSDTEVPPALTYDIKVKNNIITNTKTHSLSGNTDCGIYNPPISGVTHNYTLEYNCFYDANDTTDKYDRNVFSETGSMVNDPLYINSANRDYHLTSHCGCYVSGSWSLVSNQVSPCIDAGHPQSDYNNEPVYNGKRINMGRYGNTPEASKSPFWLKNSVTGEYLHNTNTPNILDQSQKYVESAGLVPEYHSYRWILVQVGVNEYKIRNFWQTEYLNNQRNPGLVYCNSDDYGDAAKWYTENLGNDRVKFKNHWYQNSNYFLYAAGSNNIQCGIPGNSESAVWIMEPVTE
ncbi:MAG: right-handed parallel beta-helix repeat-containing protein [Clostridiaceae bacterium]